MDGVTTMARRTITKFWIFGAVALAISAILIIADGVALADHLAARPAGGQGLTPDDFSRTLVGLIALGVSVAAIGIVAALVAWVGALANSRGQVDRRWFDALLWTGAVGILTLLLFGLGALIAGSGMIAYLVGGPDTTASARPPIWAKSAILRLSARGLVLMVAAMLVALVVSNQTNPSGLLHGHPWPSLVLLMACVVVAVCGVIVESVAWWAALFNTRRLTDQTWFTLLAWSGIASALTMPLFGLGALIAVGIGIAYRNAAPDALAADDSPRRGHAVTA